MSIDNLVLISPDHPVFEACKNGDIEVVRRALEEGISVYSASPEHPTIGFLACQFGHVDIVKLLVERGFDPNSKGGLREVRPLHNALMDGHLDVVQYLLSQGADPNAVDNTGYHLLLPAARFPKIVKALLDAGADPHMKTRQGYNGFLTAAEVNQVEVLEMLHQRGFDVNYQPLSKNTALHEAAMKGNREASEWLLAHGADRTLKNIFKKTARDVALQHGHTEIADLVA